MNKISKRTTVAAGVAIVRLEGGEYKYLMLRNNTFWEPGGKGKVEEGETKFDAALREVEEETTIKPNELDFKWGKVSYETERYGKGKTATYYLAQTNRNEIEIPFNPEIGKKEHDEYVWMTYDEAMKVANARIKKVLTWVNDLIK